MDAMKKLIVQEVEEFRAMVRKPPPSTETVSQQPQET
jgi:hypothetical protein